MVGFEYGFATAEPNALVIWEAQFGDFVNGAQVVIDQFISSGETKWGRVCGLVMFLPHGYSGRGPSIPLRSSRALATLRRAQHAGLRAEHRGADVGMLRRQMLRPFRKPLIVMTPKSLLRKKEASSHIHEFANGAFQTVIPDVESPEAKEVKRIVACSGKVYYDLAARRAEAKRTDVAIIRVEQLYPFPHKQLEAEMKRYMNVLKWVWCQEEPQNQGVVPERALLPREYARRPEAVLCRPPAVGRPGHRLHGAPTKGSEHWSSRRSENTNSGNRGQSPISESRRVTRWFFDNPVEAQRKPGKTVTGEVDDRRSEGAAIVGVRRRGDAARLAQEGRREGLARREPDRHRDR